MWKKNKIMYEVNNIIITIYSWYSASSVDTIYHTSVLYTKMSLLYYYASIVAIPPSYNRGGSLGSPPDQYLCNDGLVTVTTTGAGFYISSVSVPVITAAAAAPVSSTVFLFGFQCACTITIHRYLKLFYIYLI